MSQFTDTLSRVQDIIADQLGIEQESASPTAKIIDDLGADSLDTVELVMAIEEEFEIEISEEKAETLLTVQEIVDTVDALRTK